MNRKIKENELLLSVEGEIERIEITDVLDTLKCASNAIKEINVELDPIRQIELYVEPIQKGSFEYLFFLADPYVLAGGLATYHIGREIISTFLDIIKLKKLLEGEVPSSIINEGENNVRVSKNNGDSLVVNGNSKDVYLNSRIVNVNIEKLFLSSTRSSDVNGIRIVNENEEFSLNREFFEKMYLPNKALEINAKTRAVIKNNVLLRIHKLVFESGPMWDFYLKGERIKAKILDTEFYERMNKDEIRFSKHLILDVQMRILQEFDNEYQVYKDVGYEILHVNKLDKGVSQENLFQ